MMWFRQASSSGKRAKKSRTVILPSFATLAMVTPVHGLNGSIVLYVRQGDNSEKKKPPEPDGIGGFSHVAPTGLGTRGSGDCPAGLRRIQAPDSQRNVTFINLRVP